jgi:predicted deacylase
MTTTPDLVFGDVAVPPGRRMNVDLEVSESYSGLPVMVPITVWRAEQPGPTVFITGAVHGDELNGTGVIRELLLNQPVDLQRGSLILVPVVNMLGLERHQRYLPDRRDLNRCFPEMRRAVSPGVSRGRFSRRWWCRATMGSICTPRLSGEQIFPMFAPI